MTAGRPSEYSELTVAKAREYLSLCKDSYDKVEGLDKPILRAKLPTLEGFALHVGIRRETIYEWKKDPEKQEFSNIVEEVLQEQAKRIIEKSISGEYNASIAKLLLTKHGYVEKVESKNDNTNVNVEADVSPEQARIIAQRLIGGQGNG